jgi:CPA2 family monovalent cation:H+ antiporter-2
VVHTDSLLVDLVLAYGLALILMVALGRLRVPPIIALILSGTLAGPAALGIVSTPEEVDQLAEIGIVLLLFTVGLEFPLREMRRLWRTVAGAGLAQVGGTAALAGATCWALGIGLGTSVFAGLFLALSSTAIVLKELGRRNRLDAPAGRVTTGILLFQDLCVVLLLLAAPMIAGAVEPAAIPGVLGRALLALAGVAVVGRYALPVLLRLVTGSGQREAFTLAVLVASVGTAAAGAALGLSMALGAFLAGLMLAGSEFSHQVHAEVRPLRDLLTSLFFISLGMLLVPAVALQHLGLIAAIALVTLLAKAVVAALAVGLAGGSLRISALAGLYLAQVGEFSFVLGRDALELGVLPPDLWNLLLPASILTMVVTPGLVSLGPRVAESLATIRRRPTEHAAAATPVSRVLILGFGVGGRVIAASLRQFDIPYAIIDLNGASVRQARGLGEPITYGDATSPDTLGAAGVAHARAVVIVLSDPDASLKAVRAIRRLAPAVPVFVRARYRTEAVLLQQEGAIAVAEELEASLEVLAQVLTRLDVPGNVVEAVLDGYRHREGLRGFRADAPSVSLEAVAPDILDAPVATHEIQPGEAAVGQTLASLRLRTDTGASVLAVRRDAGFMTTSLAEFPLRSGDVLYLLGDQPSVRSARERLTGRRMRLAAESPESSAG